MSPEEGKSWYDTGFDGMKREEDRIATMSGPQRVWIPPQSSKELVFLDDDPVCIHEHCPKMNGHYRNWITCLNGVYDDVACCEILSTKGRYYVGYFSVIDCSAWTDKKGNKYQYEQKLLPAKLKTLKKLKRKREDRGTLVGCLFKVHREDEKSPVCGDEFDFQREADMDKLFQLANYKGKRIAELFSKAGADDGLKKLMRLFQVEVHDGEIAPRLVPFNYVEILAPKPSKDVRDMLGGGKNVEESSGGDSTSSDDDQIPF